MALLLCSMQVQLPEVHPSESRSCENVKRTWFWFSYYQSFSRLLLRISFKKLASLSKVWSTSCWWLTSRPLRRETGPCGTSWSGSSSRGPSTHRSSSRFWPGSSSGFPAPARHFLGTSRRPLSGRRWWTRGRTPRPEIRRKLFGFSSWAKKFENYYLSVLGEILIGWGSTTNWRPPPSRSCLTRTASTTNPSVASLPTSSSPSSSPPPNNQATDAGAKNDVGASVDFWLRNRDFTCPTFFISK